MPINPYFTASSLYVGTDKNCIVEGSLQHKFSYIMWGHVGQVLTIAAHPSDTATFATGGANDRMVVKWRKQRVAWKLEIQSAICSLSWHANGKVVVAGTEEGNLMALNGESGFVNFAEGCRSKIDLQTSINPIKKNYGVRELCQIELFLRGTE